MILAIQIAAIICFLGAAFNAQVPKARPIGWGWVGLALWLFSLMLDHFGVHPAH